MIGMVYPLEAQEFIPVFVLSLFCSIFSFLCVVLSINVWLLVPILSSLPLNCMLVCDLRPRLSVCYYTIPVPLMVPVVLLMLDELKPIYT
jgi:uncharacterized BrkB/YihY/UPF0761 family membrane protein